MHVRKTSTAGTVLALGIWHNFADAQVETVVCASICINNASSLLRAGKRKQKQYMHLSQDRIATAFQSLLEAPAERSMTPPPHSSTNPPTQAQTPTRQPVPSPSSLSPLSRSPGGSRPLLDPFEPLFTVEDDEDAKALEEIEGVIQLILDVTPRRGSQYKQQRSEGLEVGANHSITCKCTT